MEKTEKSCSAVILAAGVGSRFGNENGTKQNVPVLGVPAVVRTVLAFEKCPLIDEIILVGRGEELPVLEGYVKEYDLSKVRRIVEGGRNPYGILRKRGECGLRRLPIRCRSRRGAVPRYSRNY